MRLKTILNSGLNFKCFCIGKSEFNEKKDSIIVEIKARTNSKPVCSICGTPSSGYDSLPERLFEFVPMWGLRVFFRYAMRRVSCPHCKRVVVEKVPWCDGKNHFTNHYAAFLASWAKELSWKSVAAHFHTSWQTVCSAVESVVNYGLTHRNLDSVTALGVDEIAWHKGHKYLTLVYQINPGARRLLWVGEKRTQETMSSFFADMTKLKTDFSAQIRVICSDMWKPYLKIIAKHLPQAINVLDRFHIMQKFGKALDKVRSEEAKRLRQAKQPPLLSKTRWCFLKRRENLTEKQGFKLNELLKMNLRTVKAYLLREQFQKLWEYRSPGWAGKFLDQWCHAATFSRIEPMKDLAKMLTAHRLLILNYFRAKKQFNSGIVEGLNRKINLTIRKSFGFRTLKIAKVCLYHQLGELPEPEFAHKFW